MVAGFLANTKGTPRYLKIITTVYSGYVIIYNVHAEDSVLDTLLLDSNRKRYVAGSRNTRGILVFHTFDVRVRTTSFNWIIWQVCIKIWPHGTINVENFEGPPRLCVEDGVPENSYNVDDLGIVRVTYNLDQTKNIRSRSHRRGWTCARILWDLFLDNVVVVAYKMVQKYHAG